MDHGDVVDVLWDGVQFFHGYVFKKSRNRERIWTVLAYDQMRYLLNKDSFSYENKTAAEVIKELAEDFEVKCGEMADTGLQDSQTAGRWIHHIGHGTKCAGSYHDSHKKDVCPLR